MLLFWAVGSFSLLSMVCIFVVEFACVPFLTVSLLVVSAWSCVCSVYVFFCGGVY